MYDSLTLFANEGATMYDDAIETDAIRPLSPEQSHELVGVLAKTMIAHLPQAEPNDVTVRIGREYDRKGYLTYDAVPGNRNPAYGGPDDDFVVSLTFRVRAYTGAYTAVNNVADDLAAAAAGAELAAVQASIEELRAQEAALRAEQDRIAAERGALEATKGRNPFTRRSR